MLPILYALVALLSLASATPFGAALHARDGSNSSDQTSFEVLYPRNETYKLDAPLPIVLAVYNAPPTASLGNYTLRWFIDGFSKDDVPGGLGYAEGSFWPRNDTSSSAPLENGKPLIVADFVDLLEVFQHAEFDFRGRLELTVWLTFGDSDVRDRMCPSRVHQGVGPYSDDVVVVGFRVELGHNGEYRNTDAVAIDLLQATGCPAQGAGVTVATTTPKFDASWFTKDGTTTRPSTCLQAQVTSTPTQTSGNCPFTVDDAMASSISSSVSVLMIPPPTETITTYSPNGAMAMPIQTGGLAAAGIIGAMMAL